MATIANMPAADVEVTWPSGRTTTVNMLRLFVQTQNAEFKVKHGMFLPGINKQHPTVRALREEYEMSDNIRTWAQVAIVMRELHTGINEAIKREQS